ncbi:hotdog domain-containing protein [Nocardioides sp. LHD-245]|uniref:thioesterase family protein n=1 Tax=Nocardioides sp. LHD-245 TaxID=3051387 RepID=UPI0027DF6520|nr:hotdog domain-containing protein [Nocardioides sp. LHD-245]
MNDPTPAARTATLTREVSAADTARAFGPDFPEAAATPFVLGLAEVACHEAIAAELADGQITVGVAATVSHRAPTPVGETLTAVASEIAREGRRLRFRVVLSDALGECAVVEHERAIVDARQIADRLRDRTRR